MNKLFPRGFLALGFKSDQDMRYVIIFCKTYCIFHFSGYSNLTLALIVWFYKCNMRLFILHGSKLVTCICKSQVTRMWKSAEVTFKTQIGQRRFQLDGHQQKNHMHLLYLLISLECTNISMKMIQSTIALAICAPVTHSLLTRAG